VQRLLARRRIFLKNTHVLERLSRVDAVVFDKTGTLTTAGAGSVSFHGATLSPVERAAVLALARQSMHPYAVRLGESLGERRVTESVQGFQETPGSGLEAHVTGLALRLGSRVWLEACGVAVPALDLPAGSAVYLAIDDRFRGVFVLAGSLRPGVTELARQLEADPRFQVALLSGDNDKEKARFLELLGGQAEMHFNQTPLEKLGFVRKLQRAGRSVMMVGDGLNDAGALKQSDVGVAVAEKAGAFSPASDVIIEASEVPHLARVLAVSRRAVLAVRVSFGISAAYNAVGVGIAAAGWLSPIVCAVLMPVSSVTVVVFACAAAHWAARRTNPAPANPI
jgi:Cu+-exporting ATPase